jgi:myo-inositol 2-dehydrogenase / D-chiro-inositol 1-dehydrogenase
MPRLDATCWLDASARRVPGDPRAVPQCGTVPYRGTILLGFVVVGSSWHTPMMRNDRVRVGVIGVGGMGTFHARTLARLAGVELAVVGDPHLPNVARLVDELGCAGSTDPMELATDPSLDAVVIASPDDSHPDLAIASLQTGHWVLCEKPLATTLAEAQRVVDAELAVGSRRIQMGFMREYDPAHVQLREAVDEMGRIDGFRSVHRNCNQVRRPVEVIIGQSIVHDFHSVHFLTGSPIVRVHSFAGRPMDGSFRHFVLVCETAIEVQAVVEFDDAGFAYEVSVDVLGQHGDATTGPPLRAVRRRNGAVETVIGPDWFGFFADAYRIQNAAWIESVRNQTAVGPSAWDGLRAQAVVESAVESFRAGRTVEVPQQPTPSMYQR